MARALKLRTPVLIIGGGPSGMVAALALAKWGVRSLVLEKRERLGQHPKAHEVSARTLEILMQLGIPFRELAAEASPHEDASRILFCRTLHEEIGRIDLNEKSISAKYAAHTTLPRPYLNLSQTELEKVLRRHVAKNKYVTLHTGTEWKSLRQNAAIVHSVARHTEHGTTLEIESEYVLCCDGAGGRCRDFLGIAMAGPEKIQDFANAYFSDDLQDRLKTRAKLYFIFKPDAAGTFIAHHAGKRWVYHVPVMTPYEKIENFTEAVFQKRIATALGDPGFMPHIESISSWRMTAQIAEKFQAGRAFLVGDAAHRFPPTGGLGLNSGVADAHNLCWKIAAVLNQQAPASLLESYERERKAIVATNCEESRKNYLNLFKIPASLGLRAALLRWLMAALGSIPLRWFGRTFHGKILAFFLNLADKKLQRNMRSRSVVARAQSVIAGQISHFDRIGLDLGFSYEPGAAPPAVSEYQPAFTVGCRLPAFVYFKAGRKCTSDTLISYNHFTLLTDESSFEAWRRYLRQIPQTAVEVRAVRGIMHIGGAKQTFKAATGLQQGGAILVRPDGHIALRCQGASTVDFAALADYFLGTGNIAGRIAA